MNIIPDIPSKSPNYWCSWSTQNYESKPIEKGEAVGALLFEGDQGSKLARDSICENAIFKDGGWIHQLPKIRKDLYFLLDDGWDVDFRVHPDRQLNRFGSLEVAQERFPSCSGSPVKRLKRLNEMVCSHGWRGLGIWVAAQNAGDFFPPSTQQARDYWAERLKWSFESGVHYWKVDWGTYCHNAEFRRMLTNLALEISPDLIIEHAYCSGPLNAYSDIPERRGVRFEQWGDIPSKTVDILNFSQVTRSYDVTAQLSIPSTIDRIAYLLEHATGLVNCEDELYLGAVLGCTMGIMRSSYWQCFDGIAYDPWQLKNRQDEAVRAIRWQRIAPAFAGTKLIQSEETLQDKWFFNRSDTWFTPVIGETILQEAPAIVARNMALPLVTCKAGKSAAPYVVAAKNPNGAVSVASLGRIGDNKAPSFPAADVTLKVEKIPTYLGVFGMFDELKLHINEMDRNISCIYAQDLAGSNSHDITKHVVKDKNIFSFSGALLTQEGLRAKSQGDSSQPGLAILIQ